MPSVTPCALSLQMVREAMVEKKEAVMEMQRQQSVRAPVVDGVLVTCTTKPPGDLATAEVCMHM